MVCNRCGMPEKTCHHVYDTDYVVDSVARYRQGRAVAGVVCLLLVAMVVSGVVGIWLHAPRAPGSRVEVVVVEGNHADRQGVSSWLRK